MKTNDFKHPVFQYIIYCIDGLEYGQDTEKMTIPEKLQFVLNTFRNEKRYEIVRIGEYEAFKDWLMGLPSSINIDYMNYKIIQLTKLWKLIPDNATEKQEKKILTNWFNFITMKFFMLCKKHKVN